MMRDRDRQKGRVVVAASVSVSFLGGLCTSTRTAALAGDDAGGLGLADRRRLWLDFYTSCVVRETTPSPAGYFWQVHAARESNPAAGEEETGGSTSNSNRQ